MKNGIFNNEERYNQVLHKNSNNYNLKMIEKLYNKACKITIDSYDRLGSGFFIKLNKYLYCLMTNEHVIKKELVKKKEIVKVSIEKKDKYFTIKLDEKERFIRSFDYMLMDIIIIQILPSDNISKDFFVKPNLKYQNNPSKIINKKILVAHFAKGLTLQITDGIVSDIETIGNEFIHKASTEKGSSGGLIIELDDDNDNDNVFALGIHKQGSKKGNVAHFIHPICMCLENDKYIDELIFNDGIYRGEIVKYKREGFGEFILRNNEEIYKGQWKKDKRNGYGIEYYKDKTIKYKGYFKDNEYNGEGTYNWENKECYEGQFLDSKAHGEGTYHYLNGDKYKGNFVNNLKEGKGTYICKNGNYFIGEWKNDVQNGIGEYYENNHLIYRGMLMVGIKCENGEEYYSNGEKKYIGEFDNDKYHGKGKLYLNNDDKFYPCLNYLLYDGEWKYGKRSGKGVEYYINGKKKYEGEFDNDNYHGNGKLYKDFESKNYQSLYYLFYNGDWKYGQRRKGIEYYSNGNKKYDGEFDNDKYHGNGKLYFQFDNQFNNRNIESLNYEGEWKLGKKSGRGKEYLPNGKLIYEGLYENNKYNDKEGRFYFKNGYNYIGSFVNGKIEGKGILFFDGNYYVDKTIEVMNNLFENPSEILDDLEIFTKNVLKGDFSQIKKYEGNFVNNNKEGFGICYYKNGTLYSGEWKNNKYDGNGTFYKKNGKFIEGKWKNGKKNGHMILYDGDSNILDEADFIEDELINVSSFSSLSKKISFSLFSVNS